MNPHTTHPPALNEQATMRPLLETDKVLLLQLVDRCGEYTRRLFEPVPTFYSRDCLRWVYGDLEKRGAQRYLAVNGCGEAVGFMYFYIYGDKAYFGIVVIDEYQRKGLGTRVIRFLEEEARKAGAGMLATGGGTPVGGPLQGLLRKLGYRDWGYWGKGKYFTLTMMEKTL